MGDPLTHPFSFAISHCTMLHLALASLIRLLKAWESCDNTLDMHDLFVHDCNIEDLRSLKLFAASSQPDIPSTCFNHPFGTRTCCGSLAVKCPDHHGCSNSTVACERRDPPESILVLNLQFSSRAWRNMFQLGWTWRFHQGFNLVSMDVQRPLSPRHLMAQNNLNPRPCATSYAIVRDS